MDTPQQTQPASRARDDLAASPPAPSAVPDGMSNKAREIAFEADAAERYRGFTEAKIAEQRELRRKSYMAGDYDNDALVQCALAALQTASTPASEGEIIERCAGQWQPIETAPKDGTWFLAFQTDDIYPCQWHVEEPGEGPGREGWLDLFNQSLEAPTHWMPLPEAPAIRTQLNPGSRGQ